jgi:hypothetical protein
MSFFWHVRFFFGVFLVENGAANESVRLRFGGSFFVLGFDKIGGQGGDLIFIQLAVIANGLGVAFQSLRGLDSSVFQEGSIRLRVNLRCGHGFRFGAGIGEKPAGKSAGEAAGNSTRASGRNNACGAQRNFVGFGLLFANFVFLDRSGHRRG